MALKSRIEKLEAQIPFHDPVTCIVLVCLRPDGDESHEVQTVTDRQGCAYTRELGENEQDFLKRAEAEARKHCGDLIIMLAEVLATDGIG